MEDSDKQLFYGFYLIFLGLSDNAQYSAIFDQFCRCGPMQNNKNCTHGTCHRVTDLVLHYDNCADPLCDLCLPVRWLILSSRLDFINQLSAPHACSFKGIQHLRLTQAERAADQAAADQLLRLARSGAEEESSDPQ